MMRIFARILVLAFVSVLMSCGGGGSGDGASSGGGAYTSVTINIGSRGSAVAANSIPAGVTTIKFTVTGEGMSTIERAVDVSGLPYVSETFDVPTGFARTFKVDALNASGQLLYTGSSTVDLMGDPVAVAVKMYIPPATPGGFQLVGVWGYSELEHDPFAFFSTEAGTATFNSDGTGVTDYVTDRGGVTTSGSDPFTFSLAPNGDGSYTYTDVNPSGSDVNRMIPSEDNGQIILLDETIDTGALQRITIPLRVDTSKTYSNADLSGDYYLLSYGFDGLYYQCRSAILTMSGAGSYAFPMVTYNNGSIGNGPGSSGTYAVSANGAFNVDGAGLGHLTGDGKMATITTPDIPTSWTHDFMLKRGDRVYSTVDLAGTWVMVGFGDWGGDAAFDEIGKVTCDAAGNCNYMVSLEFSDGTSSSASGSMTLSVAPDGSFGSGIFAGSPPEAGALGNGGNVFMMNRCFDTGTPYYRDIWIGTRCSACDSFIP